MYEKGNSYPSYSHMDQKDLPCAGMFGMSVVRTGGRVNFERIYGEGRCGAGLCDDLRIALERKKRIKAAYEQEYEIKWDMIHISERISIMLPEGAAELEEEKSIKRFGRNENKRIVMTIPGDEANFLFQFQRSTVNGPESVQAMCDSLKNMIMRLQPANFFYSDGMEDTDHVDIRWF